jgi:hypothetical protein
MIHTRPTGGRQRRTTNGLRIFDYDEVTEGWPRCASPATAKPSALPFRTTPLGHRVLKANSRRCGRGRERKTWQRFFELAVAAVCVAVRPRLRSQEQCGVVRLTWRSTSELGDFGRILSQTSSKSRSRWMREPTKSEGTPALEHCACAQATCIPLTAWSCSARIIAALRPRVRPLSRFPSTTEVWRLPGCFPLASSDALSGLAAQCADNTSCTPGGIPIAIGVAQLHGFTTAC